MYAHSQYIAADRCHSAGQGERAEAGERGVVVKLDGTRRCSDPGKVCADGDRQGQRRSEIRRLAGGTAGDHRRDQNHRGGVGGGLQFDVAGEVGGDAPERVIGAEGACVGEAGQAADGRVGVVEAVGAPVGRDIDGEAAHSG